MRKKNQLTIPNSFIALNTSFIISCGFDWDLIPKCHLAFFNDAAPDPLFPVVVVVVVVVELEDFRLWDVGWRELVGLLEDELFMGLFVLIGSNVTLKSFKAKYLKKKVLCQLKRINC